MNSTVSINFKGALQAKAAEPVIPLLLKVLESSLKLEAASRSAHWNVTGITFSQLHSLFGEVYDLAGTMIDDVAERVRQLDAFVPSVPPAGYAGGPQNANEWVRAVQGACEQVVVDWIEVQKVTGEIPNLEIQDLSIRYNQELMKKIWMLKATAG